MKRYELLAEEIAASIRSGMLDVGDRLPSVRQISTSRGVSVSTVFEAYYLLEARGLINALAADDRRNPYELTALGERALRARLASIQAVTRVGQRRLANA